MVHGIGSLRRNLGPEDLQSIIAAGTAPDLYRSKRVLVLTPDATRTCPLPMMVRTIREVIGSQSAQLDFMVALGTQTPLAEKELMALYGISADQRADMFGRSHFFNHRWDRPETFARIGQLGEKEVADICGGLLKEALPVDYQ
jgi:nickel-dependent lactate racemase